MPGDDFVLFLNGVYGVGKSTVLDHLADLLAARQQPFALFDVDWFHRSWPPGKDDPGNVETEAENLAAVWANYRRRGPRQAVVAGVLACAGDTARYERTFELPLRPILLTAPADVLERRLRHRYPVEREEALRWHLDRIRADAEKIRAARQFETVIDTRSLSPADVARAVLAYLDGAD